MTRPLANLTLAVAVCAALGPAAAAAQDVTAQEVPGQDPTGGITTQKLEPLPPRAEGDSRFKPAPFKTDAPAVAPVLIDPIETTERAGARLRQLDKMTGRTQTFELEAGGETTVDRLKVRLGECRSPEDNAQHGTMAYLEVWDTKTPDAPAVFSGWMFAESPALSAMDHPRYDLWVINCTTRSGAAAAASE